MNLVAKPIVKGEYWVVTDGDKKVGNVIANGSGYDVKLHGNVEHFENTSAIKRKRNIEFVNPTTNKKEVVFNDYPTPDKTYNNVYDVKRKLHLFTMTPKSKCYHASGYFAMKQNEEKSVIFCPKYIFIQRYQYIGPFKTKTEAENMINIL